MRGCLLQAGALMDVALNGGLLECGRSTIIEYLSVLSDIIIKAEEIHECAFSDLQKSKKQYHFLHEHL